MPGCLHPKLLSICNQCYAPPGFDSTGIGWLEGDPGPCGNAVDSAMVGRVGSAIVVGYRGTLSPDGPDIRSIIDDWVNNAQVAMVPQAGFGDVHQGFFQSHRALWGQVRDGIRARLDPKPKAIIVTGHSKGGALAFLGAMAIREDPELRDIPVHVVTFAGARVGGQTFADRYRALNIPTLRYENRADLVPYVPLAGSMQPFVWHLLQALGARYKVTGYTSVGDALTDGPGAFAVTLSWLGLGRRIIKTGNLRDSAIPLVDAHRIDPVLPPRPSFEYPRMVVAQAERCASHRHAECLAALG